MAAETEWPSPGGDLRLLQHVEGSLALSRMYIDAQRLRALAGLRRSPGPVAGVEAAALGLLDALQLSLGILATRGMWSLEQVLEVHWTMLRGTDPWRAGRLRQISAAMDQTLPLPVLIPSLVRDALQGVTLDLERGATPFESAARLHQRLMLIRPFAHGNGRAARLFCQGVLSAAGIEPVRFLRSDSGPYFEALEQRATPNGWRSLAALLEEAAGR